MNGFLRRFLVIIVSIAVVAGAFFGVFSVIRMRYEAELAGRDATAAEMAAAVQALELRLEKANELAAQLQEQIDAHGGTVDEMSTSLEELQAENERLQGVIDSYAVTVGFPGLYDTLTVDRALPLDLVSTVLAYYKSIVEKDLETYKTIYKPASGAGDESDYEHFTDYSPGPTLGDGVKLIAPLTSDAENIYDIGDPAYSGNVVLCINYGYDIQINLGDVGAETLYLHKADGVWYVHARD